MIKVEPGYYEVAGITELYMRVHFDYNPRQDRLIPSQDAGDRSKCIAGMRERLYLESIYYKHAHLKFLSGTLADMKPIVHQFCIATFCMKKAKHFSETLNGSPVTLHPSKKGKLSLPIIRPILFKNCKDRMGLRMGNGICA